MYKELTNLLPVERRMALARDYRLRLAVVAGVFLVAIAVIATALLFPTYLLLAKSIASKQTRIQNIESTLSSQDEAGLSARLAVLSNDTATLSALGKATSPSTVLRTVLAVPRPGVTFSSFSYSPASGSNPPTLSIRGTAATRNALRNYQLVLQAAPFARSVNLPVSAFAQDVDIAFAITVALNP